MSLVIIFNLVWLRSAWAEGFGTKLDSLTELILIFAGIVGAIAAVALAGFTRKNKPAAVYQSKKIPTVKNISKKISPGDPVLDIVSRINTLSGSKKTREKTVERISNFLNERIEKEVSSVKQDLTEQYGKIIEGKELAAAEALEKYKKTFAEKQQTEGVIHSLAEGLMVVNNKGEVMLMNPAAEKLLGVSQKEKMGQPLLDGAKDEQLFSFVKGGADQEDKEIELTSKEDTKKILRSSSAVIEDENGNTVGMVSVLSDITKQKELDQLKSDFVAKVSHELRNPIGVIKQSLSVILSKAAGEVSQQQERFLSNAQRSLDRLSLLIDNLLDLSKLEAKKTDLKTEILSIENIITEVCENMNIWAVNKGIKLKKSIQPNLPKIPIDANKIIQVINNIIGNALKFTLKNGTIIVEARLLKETKRVEVSIADNGPGIPGKDLAKIFDKFHQSSGKKAAETKGTGLGLAIAKEIVTLHKGKIRAESAEGQGAKFIFTLPLT